ncbi:hypothetical protein Ahy_A06g026771 [Arachis hypogaea]|uniref:Disease resistance N-terminal domain-containing protein n=1 Tax=Arachis hypogaea TaxID=3818 RepID=A0A445CLH5_ARAHY|nr:hypothetical protein Ahy_A06g026771 [Arachis hypogaea]
MAESFIFSIAESLITKLASRAYQEASRVVGVYDDLQDLKTSLSYVKAVLLDAEQKQEQNHELREWLKQIKLVFYDAENLLDEVDCESLRKQLRITQKDKVGGFFSSSNPLLFRYKISQQIKEIRKRLDRVAADRDKFGLQTIAVDRRVGHKREMTYSHVVESDVIGRDHDKEKIDISENVLHLSFVENGLPYNSVKPSLRVLLLDGCSNLETVPKKLRKLISLQRLGITTKQSILPESDIAKLNCLEYLRVEDCDNLESLFAETRLPTLLTLQVIGCANLKSLPLDTHHFPQLETMLIEGVGNEDWLHRSENTNSVLRLKTISLYNMVTLPHSLQQYASTLQTLMIGDCYELEVLPEWQLNLSALKFLYIWDCPELKSLPSDIHRLTSLQVLQIINCTELYRKYKPQVGECWPMISHIKHTEIRKTWD